jgi:hypothetical protein
MAFHGAFFGVGDSVPSCFEVGDSFSNLGIRWNTYSTVFMVFMTISHSVFVVIYSGRDIERVNEAKNKPTNISGKTL